MTNSIKGTHMRRTIIIAGSVVAGLATAGALAVSGGAQAPAPGQTIEFVEKGGTFKNVDTPPRAKHDFDASPGDMFVFSRPLYTSANKRYGSLNAKCTFTKGGRAASGVCEGVYALPTGDLYAAAKLGTGKTTTGVITGGTRAYAGARGTFKSVTRSGDNAPSDTTITLLP